MTHKWKLWYYSTYFLYCMDRESISSYLDPSRSKKKATYHLADCWYRRNFSL